MKHFGILFSVEIVIVTRHDEQQHLSITPLLSKAPSNNQTSSMGASTEKTIRNNLNTQLFHHFLMLFQLRSPVMFGIVELGREEQSHFVQLVNEAGNWSVSQSCEKPIKDASANRPKLRMCKRRQPQIGGDKSYFSLTCGLRCATQIIYQLNTCN